MPLSLIFSFISNRETFAGFYLDKNFYLWHLRVLLILLRSYVRLAAFSFFFFFLIVGRVNGTYILVYGYTTSGEKGDRGEKGMQPRTHRIRHSIYTNGPEGREFHAGKASRRANQSRSR